MEKDKPRGVSLSPKAMVDSVADWPLSQVIEHLKKREKEDKDKGRESVQPSRLHCRSTVKSLVDVVDSVADGCGLSRNRLSRYLSYHGIAIAREDLTIARLATTQSFIRDACLLDDDTDTLDIMNSLMPYSPRVIDDNSVHLFVYDSWVASDFEDMARVCSVHKYCIVQVYLIKSIMSGDIDRLGETAARLEGELKRWDTWMGFRLAALEKLAELKKK